MNNAELRKLAGLEYVAESVEPVSDKVINSMTKKEDTEKLHEAVSITKGGRNDDYEITFNVPSGQGTISIDLSKSVSISVPGAKVEKYIDELEMLTIKLVKEFKKEITVRTAKITKKYEVDDMPNSARELGWKSKK